jgi:hypothetical protein
MGYCSRILHVVGTARLVTFYSFQASGLLFLKPGDSVNVKAETVVRKIGRTWS